MMKLTVVKNWEYVQVEDISKINEVYRKLRKHKKINNLTKQNHERPTV